MQLEKIANLNLTVIDISHIPEGIYFVKVITGKGVFVEKLVHE
jgi:hypothetical protein